MKRDWRSEPFRGCLAAAAAAALLLNPGLPARAQGVFDSITEEVQQIFVKASPAVVRIRAFSGTQPLAGSGFFIDDQGTLLTSYAIIRDARKAWIEIKDEKKEVKILGTDPRSGLALLKADFKPQSWLKLGNSDHVKIASGLISVAYPYNLPASPSFGFVTGFDVRYLDKFFATTHIRANLGIRPGQIGGPVLNTKGEVVGMLVLSIQNGSECYIIPVNPIHKIVADMQEFGHARHGWVGVGVVEGQMTSEGGKPVVVSQIFNETPAVNSGIKPGDVVLKIGDRDIRQPSDVLDAAFFAHVGKAVPVVVSRAGETRQFSLEIAERPETSSLVNQVRPPSVPVQPDGGRSITVKGGN
jgi:S1-C subfamily serine protease